MKSKNIIALSLLLAMLTLGAGVGFADSSSSSENLFPPIPTGGSPYMTLENSTLARLTFGWNDKPFSYVLFPTVDTAQMLQFNRIWKYGNDVVATQNETYSGESPVTYWKGLDNWFDSGVRKNGQWSVETIWNYSGSKYQFKSTDNFTVTPEPIGAALFLLGGFALSSRKYFKSKKQLS